LYFFAKVRVAHSYDGKKKVAKKSYNLDFEEPGNGKGKGGLYHKRDNILTRNGKKVKLPLMKFENQ
jgi:hypothetical protein